MRFDPLLAEQLQKLSNWFLEVMQHKGPDKEHTSTQRYALRSNPSNPKVRHNILKKIEKESITNISVILYSMQATDVGLGYLLPIV
jgi:hypothetical protein